MGAERFPAPTRPPRLGRREASVAWREFDPRLPAGRSRSIVSIYKTAMPLDDTVLSRSGHLAMPPYRDPDDRIGRRKMNRSAPWRIDRSLVRSHPHTLGPVRGAIGVTGSDSPCNDRSARDQHGITDVDNGRSVFLHGEREELAVEVQEGAHADHPREQHVDRAEKEHAEREQPNDVLRLRLRSQPEEPHRESTGCRVSVSHASGMPRK